MNAGPGAVVFTDLVGFTEFTASRGDTVAVALLDRQDRLVRAALKPGARVVKELGDGLLLWFHDIVDAVLSCLELLERFDSDTSDELPLGVRIGMHWGTPTRRGDDLVGHTVNVAARIVDLAGPGELLLSDPARCEADGRVAGLVLDELGPMMMKGLPEPVQLFRVARDHDPDPPVGAKERAWSS